GVYDIELYAVGVRLLMHAGETLKLRMGEAKVFRVGFREVGHQALEPQMAALAHEPGEGQELAGRAAEAPQARVYLDVDRDLAIKPALSQSKGQSRTAGGGFERGCYLHAVDSQRQVILDGGGGF